MKSKGETKPFQLSCKTLLSAMLAANDAYIAREAGAAVLNKSGVQADCAHGIKTVEGMTDPQFATINAYDLGRAFLSAIKCAPVKVVKRFPQLIKFLATNDGQDIARAGSARTMVLAVGAVALCDAKNASGVRRAATGRGNENSADEVNEQAIRDKLSRIGITSPASFATQYSVAFGKNGLGGLLGVGSKSGKGSAPVLNRENPVTVAILSSIAALSDVAVEQIRDAMQGDESTAQ